MSPATSPTIACSLRHFFGVRYFDCCRGGWGCGGRRKLFFESMLFLLIFLIKERKECCFPELVWVLFFFTSSLVKHLYLRCFPLSFFFFLFFFFFLRELVEEKAGVDTETCQGPLGFLFSSLIPLGSFLVPYSSMNEQEAKRSCSFIFFKLRTQRKNKKGRQFTYGRHKKKITELSSNLL